MEKIPKLIDQERLLALQVHGCIHRKACTTGCAGREAKLLHAHGITPDLARGFILKWKEHGFPQEFLTDLDNPMHSLWVRDLEYKEFVIKFLDRKLAKR
jgi:hypothetical protein